jgi:hypothetical protein
MGVGISDVNLVAIAWARDHAGELLGTKWYDNIRKGRPVLLPGETLGTKWYDREKSTELGEKCPISESVRLAIRAIIVDAFSRFIPMKNLVKMIQDVSGFSNEQAEIIADTEMKFAQSRGNLEAWKRTGVVKTIRWVLSGVHYDRDECDLNAEAGAIPLGTLFPSGDEAPPAHRGCSCSCAIAELNELKSWKPA